MQLINDALFLKANILAYVLLFGSDPMHAVI